MLGFNYSQSLKVTKLLFTVKVFAAKNSNLSPTFEQSFKIPFLFNYFHFIILYTFMNCVQLQVFKIKLKYLRLFAKFEITNRQIKSFKSLESINKEVMRYSLVEQQLQFQPFF